MSSDAVPPSKQQLPGASSYTIGGIKVEFPTKAYPSQLAMMNKVIQGLKHKQNCLLESPTGSGKSLALLCSALAWQRHEAARVAEHNAQIEERQALQQEQLKQQHAELRQQQKQLESNGKKSPNGGGQQAGGGGLLEKDDGGPVNANPCGGPAVAFTFEMTDDEDDFKPTKKSRLSSTLQSPGEIKIKTSGSQNGASKQCVPQNGSSNCCNGGSTKDGSSEPYFEAPDKKLEVPKVYFGTRTHKQIAQITRELRKTHYKTVRSVILASREHTCVNPLVEKLSNKNEACKELLDNAHANGGGCQWQQAAKKMANFGNLPNYGLVPGYDLEDFVQAGRSAKACPYYASRYLMPTADVIFCPYNYLVDPFIRKSMAIELSGQVVILDEAHNIEDSSRDAASSATTQEEMQAAMQDCEKVARGGTEPYAHEGLSRFLSIMSMWMDKQAESLKQLDYNTEGTCWNGTDFVASMVVHGISESEYKKFTEFFRAVTEHRESQMEIQRERGGSRFGLEKPVVTQATTGVFEVLFRMFDKLNYEGGKHRDDFRLALMRTVQRKRGGRGANLSSKSVLTLNFWCLNPAVAFCELKEQVHSIVLTSGTLSPMQSFESELGTPFPIKLEAAHVIDRNQVWAGVLSVGPTNQNLNGSYNNVSTLQYQDELGKVVYRVCDTVQHGVLCFFPSYRLLETVTKRWQLTEQWKQLEALKDIFIEPRTGNTDFVTVINCFYNSIDYTNSGPVGRLTGALFLAVCRGKVSEGLDFADNNARAVICIGIPFPNFNDLQVQMKRDYNTSNVSRGLLPAGEWYEIQAFRALNQALGRCIRHRHDWGAILLVDDRFAKSPRYVNSLSKWVRSSIVNYDDWKRAEESIVSFHKRMVLTTRAVQAEMPFEASSNEPRPMRFESNSLDVSGANGAGPGQDPMHVLGNSNPASSGAHFSSGPQGFSSFSSHTGTTSNPTNSSMALQSPVNSSYSGYFSEAAKTTPKPLFSIFAHPQQKPKKPSQASLRKKHPLHFDDEDEGLPQEDSQSSDETPLTFTGKGKVQFGMSATAGRQHY